MLSFEEKKAIFQSFKLKEKQNGNGKVSFVYPESVQKGQVLATQLHSSGNGYVIGKYMTEETIKEHGFQVDPRGWISIKVLSKEEIGKVITEAIKSMSGGEVKALLPEIEGADQGDFKPAETAEKMVLEETLPADEVVDIEEAAFQEADAGVKEDVEAAVAASLSTEGNPAVDRIAADRAERERVDEPIQQGTYEFYPSSYLSAWTGLALSTMEYGYLVWRKSFRDLVGAAPAEDKE
ncbi:hypothetical protein V7266_06835 [Neobacillus drentensis]|uniref:hypothetical protein n=1 Tax=Neobacillus drentensis TaxID=220684 RepID=UPI003000151E